MRAVVVGAGLGGLVAAHGLRSIGVDVEVFEARRPYDAGGLGYRINVSVGGDRALRGCLSPENFAEYRATVHRQPTPLVDIYSPSLELILRRKAPGAPGAIDRGTLLTLLAKTLDAPIHWASPVGSVDDLAGFDLVVAADGVGSALRRRLLPGYDPAPLGITALYGRSRLTDSNRSWIGKTVLDSRFTGVTDGATTLALGAFDVPSSISEPYVMWVLLGPADEFPTRGQNPAELVEFTRQRLSAWDPRATAVLHDAIVDDTFRITLRAMDVVPEMTFRSSVPVAFLGDAIHAMSPAGGEGANTAFIDAYDLRTRIAAGSDVQSAVLAYHESMKDRAKQTITRSKDYSRTGA
ncbi:hypothetical protein CH254_11155 [Rhodococcus sp. 06-412-2C]|uniref:FAD-dependent oxidoreductase n=1 Tax=unclassified Rhodococcus (in: high G+C Gram-positive bacteria) TaxID=192944 RepID=UPI000B9BFF0E|nr:MULTISPECIES: FAD-dependent monooxygenase [unclassified Rhodococcus (in: high G+C Gram-positive bacteria)]OZC88474.1 hypothetical protein CH254_11155 [Rhodococcus sp. 06-412-2C]OZC90213.1 hypothetical protein CH279_29730 [Rhodococcus sp. 06-412-2B]